MTEFFSRLWNNMGRTPAAIRRREAVEKGKPRIGLALSSGAAKGLAHIGVIQVLEEHGIKIDAIAGSSMGAYVGSLWAAGFDGRQLQEFAATIRNRFDALRLLDPAFPFRRGYVRGRKIRDRLEKSIGKREFKDLERKLLVVATDLEHLSRKVFDSGPVVDAVHASIAIPGICEPVNINDVEYTDGGVSEPLPVSVLKEAGMDKVIAVCVMPTVDELQFLNARARARDLKGWRGWLHRHFNYWLEGNLFHIQRSAEFGMQMRLAELSMREADVKIRPIVCEANWYDYAGHEKYIAVGRQAATRHLDEILRLVRPEPAPETPGSRVIIPAAEPESTGYTAPAYPVQDVALLN